MQDEPIDPFNGDPADPAASLDDPVEESPLDPLTEVERQDVIEDLADLEIYQALLGPTGIRGLVIECEDCREPHYFDWDLLRGNLRHLLDSGRPRVHEPAYDPDPDHYVTWEYARGYADGVHDTLSEGTEDKESLSRRFSSGDQPGPEPGGHRVRAVPGAELAEQPAGVGLDGVLRDEQLPADLRVALAVGHAEQHLHLALGQADPTDRPGRARG